MRRDLAWFMAESFVDEVNQLSGRYVEYSEQLGTYRRVL